MKHLCDCGEIVEAEGSPLIATCPHCGSYYLYPEQIRPVNLETTNLEEDKPKPRAAKRR